jgi:hypothetical protein
MVQRRSQLWCLVRKDLEPGEKFSLQLAADAVRDVILQRDASGIT